MITEVLVATINEVLLTCKFEISEFQLGKKTYDILKSEVEGSVSNTSINIESINHFMGIPVTMHENEDAIMYCLKLRR